MRIQQSGGFQRFAAVFTVALLCGCASTGEEGSAQLGSGTVSLGDRTQAHLEVLAKRLTRNRNGDAWLQVDLRNATDESFTFSQKVEWLNRDGQVLPSAWNRWKARTLAGAALATISEVAPSQEATDVRLQLIQRARHSAKAKPGPVAEASPEVAPVRLARLQPMAIRAQQPKRPRAALVIGIEDYKRLPSARHARNDAKTFATYADRALGVSREDMVEVYDGDADNFGIQDAIRRMGSYVTPETDLYVYFSGHGFSSGEGVPYLIPQDGDARFLDRIASREEIFASLDELRAHSVTVFLDTCYSGRSREGGALHEGMRPLVLASEGGELPDGFAVISAAGATEFSGDLAGVGHGLFSYYLMRGLQGDADGDADQVLTLEELHDYVQEEVVRQAARVGREQRPELSGEGSAVLVRY
jgi:hypothetical protein